jgi:hypothetical protein
MVGLKIVDNWIINRLGLWGIKRFVEQNDDEGWEIKDVGVREEIKEM